MTGAAARRVLVGGAIALALLVLGDLAPGFFPVYVSVEAVGGNLVVTADGNQKTFKATAPNWDRVELIQPGPTQREYQIDGSDLTSREDRDAEHIAALQPSPLYRLAAWLRDEDSFSRWEQVRVVDLANGTLLADGRAAVEALRGLPPSFRLEAALRRPEAEASLWLVAESPKPERTGMEVNRDRRVIRWLDGEKGSHQVAEWYFPEQWQPFAASLVPLFTRSLAAGYAVLGLALLLAGVAQRVASLAPSQALGGLAEGARRGSGAARVAMAAFVVLPLAGWTAAATWVMVKLYAQMPHIVDAVSYYLQANIFRTGRLWFDPPPLIKVFRGYHQVVADGRWYTQYAPGAPMAYALGGLVGLQWLVGPLAGAAMIGATALAGRVLFGKGVALATLGLGVLSPFILFQAGAFMSHAVAGAWLGGAVATFALAERTRRLPWYAATGALLGLGFVTREVAGVLVALPIGLWLVGHRRWRGLLLLILAGLPLLAAYLAYNAALTGDPLTLPRHLVNPDDRFGFGEQGATRHTLAAGLANTDENVTLLQFDLFGWPPLFALSLFSLPFLLRRADRRDVLLAVGILAFVAAHVGYFYHGIVLGPRYYYEALPWMLLLAARGLQAVVATVHDFGLGRAPARVGVAAVVGLLSLNTALYYVPRLVERRVDYASMARNRGLAMPFVQPSLAGPQLVGFEGQTLVIVNDERIFKTLFPLNCPSLDKRNVNDCPTLFVGAQLTDEAETLRQYPGRTVLKAKEKNGVIALEPYQPS